MKPMEKMALLGVGTATATLLALQQYQASLPHHPDPKIDAAIKAAIGAALLLAASKLKGVPHQLVLGLGGGMVALALYQLMQTRAR